MTLASPTLVVPGYLDLLDRQREAALGALDGIAHDDLWRRPARRGWSIGEILNHNHLVLASALPYVRLAWRLLQRHGERNRTRPYRKDIPDLYRDGKFPMWVGFLWTPRFGARRRVPASRLADDLRALHHEVRRFYEGRAEDVLGNVCVYDPYFGRLNLIVTLRLGLYHDQLHYEDVLELLARRQRSGDQPDARRLAAK